MLLCASINIINKWMENSSEKTICKNKSKLKEFYYSIKWMRKEKTIPLKYIAASIICMYISMGMREMLCILSQFNRRHHWCNVVVLTLRSAVATSMQFSNHSSSKYVRNNMNFNLPHSLLARFRIGPVHRRECCSQGDQNHEIVCVLCNNMYDGVHDAMQNVENWQKHSAHIYIIIARG